MKHFTNTTVSIHNAISLSRSITMSLGLLLLPACAIVFDGNDQVLSLNTSPSGATCTLVRNGETLKTVTTPATFTIEKTKYDIDISCSKRGYETASYHNHSGIDWWTAGDVALLSPGGWIVDSATGSDNKYDSPINLTLTKK